MKTKFQKTICNSLAMAMCLSLFVLTGIEVKANDTVTIKITYLYVDESGNNQLITKEATVAAGTTWGQFLASEEYKSDYAPTVVVGERDNLVTSYNNVNWGDFMKYDTEITNFNSYYDYAMLDYSLYNDGYEKIYFGFEYYEGDELKNSGTGWDMLISSSYEFGGEDAISYIKSNYSNLYSEIDYCAKNGASLEVTTRDNSYNNLYKLTFRSAAGSSDNADSSSNSSNEETQDSREEQARETLRRMTEPTTETIANPSKTVTYQQAVNSFLSNIKQTENSIKAGSSLADTPAEINLGNYHSLSINTLSQLEDVNFDIILTYKYNGSTYTIKIPKGYEFDNTITWYGPLYLYQLFGQSIQ